MPQKLLDLNFFLHLAIILPCILICGRHQHKAPQPKALYNIFAYPPPWFLYIAAPTLFLALYSFSRRKRTPDRSLSLALQCSTMAVMHVATAKGESFQTICMQHLPIVLLLAMVFNEYWFGGVEIRERTAETEA